MRSLIASALLVACSAPPSEHAAEPVPLEVGDARTIVLHTFALDVRDYELVLDAEALRALPPAAIDELWLLDLPMQPVVLEILHRLARLPAEERDALEPAAANLQALLTATPDSIELHRTSFEALESLSGQVGIPLARPLSALFQVGIDEPLLSPEALAAALTDGLVASHPESPAGALPVTLGDLLRGFDGLAARYGPDGDHPGYLTEATDVRAIDVDAFEVALKVDANALPFEGVDLGSVAPGRVNSIGSQLDTLFDTSEPDWLRLGGLLAEPRIGTLGLRLGEDPALHGPSPERADPRGSTAFTLAPWTVERIVGEAALSAAAELEPVTDRYALGTGATVFEVALDATGWTTFRTFADVGDPPPAAYLWDVVLEIAQARLHDRGVAEGDAVAAFTLTDLPLGTTGDAIATEVTTNLAANPEAMRPLAMAVTDNSVGAPDLYYRPVRSGDELEDWLFFVHPEDIPLRADGPDRPYDYTTVGFFADEQLTERVSGHEAVAGDTRHQKVRVVPGDTLFVADDAGAVFRLSVLGKPSRSRIELEVARVR